MPSKVSIKTVLNTPQAVNDSFAGLEDLVSYLDVLANDGGGNAASLYALMGTGLSAGQIATALQSPVRTDYQTSLGAKASIITTGEHAGTISYDASALDYLAEGQVATDTFSYVIQLGNGTFSIATVTVTVTGTNDRPVADHVIVGAAAGIVEDGLAYRGSFDADDIDNDDDPTSLTYQILSQPGEGSVTIDPDNSAGFIFDPGVDFQDLEEGETRTVTFTYQAVDRHGAVSEPATVSITVTGQTDVTNGSAIDGYIAGALVFRDSNDNNAWDHEAFEDINENGIFDTGDTFTDENGDGEFDSEFFAVTDGQGNFANLGGTGRIVMTPLFGGSVNLTTDISTGAAWEGRYSAPAGSTVVTPLTTLLDNLVVPGASEQDIVDAMALLAGALGIDPSIDLQTFDPIAAVVGETDPAALALAVEVQKIAVQVANIIAVIDETLQAAGVDDGGALAAAALAAEIEASGGTTDLTSAALIQTVIEEAAAGTPAQAAVADEAAAIAEALSGINEVIDAVDETGDPLGALAAVVAAQIVAQENLATDAAAAVGGGDPVDTTAYEGTSLVGQLDEAAGEVETIIPEEDTGSTLAAPERPVVDDGARVNAAEKANGIVVTVTFDASAGLAENDKLNLLLNGTVVAFYTLTAADVAASGPLVQTFNVDATTLGADGSKVLTSQFETLGGEFGPASLPALVTVDTVAPTAPIGFSMTDGTIITTAEASDGAQVVGQTEVGSIVTVTFRNSLNQTLVKEATVTDTTFTVSLSAAEIDSLGEGYVSYTAVARDAAGNTSGFNFTGQYFYTDQPVVDAANRIDVAGAYAEQNEDVQADVTALPGGGFAVSWLADSNDDGDGDTFAFQKYAADGSKDGAPVLLQGLATNILQFGDQVDTYDLTALADGSYVLAYALERESVTRTVSGTMPPNAPIGSTVGFLIPGIPEVVQVISAPPGTQFSLRAFQNNTLINVPLTVVDGQILITQANLDMFPVDNRISLVAANVPNGQSVSVAITASFDVTYDTDAPLLTANLGGTVGGPVGGTGGFILGAPGRPESWDIGSLTPSTVSNVTPSYMIVIIPGLGTQSLSVGGISGVSVASNGAINIMVTPDANGVIEVPQTILDQLGGSDAVIYLQLGGLAAGSTVSATAQYRPQVAVPEGVFVQTFDADGVATSTGNTPVSSLPYMSSEDDDTYGVETSALPNGGFAVHWLTDTNGDGDGDTFAIQRYGANHLPDGATITLQNLSTNLTQNGERVEHLDLTALDNGGYALAYSMELETATRNLTVTSNGSPISILIPGRPEFVYVGSAPPGATFALRAFGGVPVPLTVENGVIHITQAVLDQFVIDNRLSLIISNVPSGQQASVSITAAFDVTYDTSVPLTQFNFSQTVGNSIFLSPPGRPESFDIEQISGNPVYTLVIYPGRGTQSVSVAGISGALVSPLGFITIPVVPDLNGVITVPSQILNQLGEDEGLVFLQINGLTAGTTLNATMQYRPQIAVPEGVFVQTFDGNGLATSSGNVRIDGAGARLASDEDVNVNVSALPGGGFAVDWITDADDSDYSDSGAIQRFDALGNPVGSTVLIDGVDVPDALVDYEGGTDVYSLTALDNGGYALAYAVERPTAAKSVTVGIPPNPTSFGIGGIPTTIIVNSAPANATFQLQGYDADENPLSFNLTVVDGEIHVPREYLDQLAEPHRAILAVNGLLPGQTANLWVETDAALTFDNSTDTEVVARTGSINVGNPGVWNVGVLTTLDGRAEGFHLDAPAVFNTVSGQPKIFQMLITVGFDPNSINLAGIVGTGGVNAAFVSPLGQIVLVFGNTAQTDFAVPQTILDQVGDRDMFNVLLGIGLAPSVTSFSGTVDVREGVAIPEGVFVQTYDENGNPAADLTLENAAPADLLFGDVGDDTIIASGIVNVMVGGAGDDTFRLVNNSAAFNSIFDFTPGADVIDLSGLDAVQGTPGDEEFLFIGNSLFTGVAGQLRFDTTPDGIVLLMDRNGDMVDDYRVFLPGHDTIDPEDLIL